MIGYKAFKSDFTCHGFQYEVGKTYEFDGDIKLCSAGFHFFENIADCFNYYSGERTRFAKVESLGAVVKSDFDSKCVTDKIKIIEEISIDEAVKMSNTGNWNSGYRNTGNWNSGNYNSGEYNTGNWNSGYRNTGNWNSGNYNSGEYNTGNGNTGNWNSGKWNTGDGNTGNWNSGDGNTGDWNKSSSNNGCFMTVAPVITMFNKPSEWTIDDWWHSQARAIMNSCPVNYTNNVWIMPSDMTGKEKEEHPEYKIAGGYLNVVEHEGDRQIWWDELSESDKQEVMSLPNFDANIFYECTGIKI